MRLSRWPKACSADIRQKALDERCGPSAMRSRLASCVAKASMTPGWPPSTATGRSRKRTSSASTVNSASTMLGLKPSPITMPSMSRALSARAALSTLSAPTTPTRSPTATDERRIGAAAAGDEHGRFVERIAVRQFGQLLAARRRACPCGAAPCRAARARAAPCSSAARRCGRRIGGDGQRVRERRRAVIAHAGDNRHEQAAGLLPLFVQQRLQARRRGRDRGQGSARTTASGSTDASALGASVQVASMIGKAPAARRASTTSGAGLSAMTANGPCSAMIGVRTCTD